VRPIVLLTLLVPGAACTGNGPTEAAAPTVGPENPSGIALRNDTSEPLTFVAAGEGSLALLDIPPRQEPGSYEDRLVAPTQTLPVSEIVGYDPTLGVTFYIWRVDQSSQVAHYARSLLVTAAELEAANGLVQITSFAP
jgi:hypothetical protein